MPKMSLRIALIMNMSYKLPKRIWCTDLESRLEECGEYLYSDNVQKKQIKCWLISYAEITYHRLCN